MDETNWRVADTGEFTWKRGFTVLATIDIAGKKYPLSLIAKGKTESVEANWFGGGRNTLNQVEAETLENTFFESTLSRRNSQEKFTPKSITDHSESGWTTQETWNNYLFNLRYNWCPPINGIDYYSYENRIFLICDSFPVHFSNESLNLAKELNIQLIKIPEGTTDFFQPLD